MCRHNLAGDPVLAWSAVPVAHLNSTWAWGSFSSSMRVGCDGRSTYRTACGHTAGPPYPTYHVLSLLFRTHPAAPGVGPASEKKMDAKPDVRVFLDRAACGHLELHPWMVPGPMRCRSHAPQKGSSLHRTSQGSTRAALDACTHPPAYHAVARDPCRHRDRVLPAPLGGVTSEPTHGPCSHHLRNLALTYRCLTPVSFPGTSSVSGH